MKIAVTSIGGPPRDPKTWSNAPAHIIAELEARKHVCVAIDSSCLTTVDKAMLAAGNIVRGYPYNAVGWFEPSRRKRGRHVAQMARAADCDLIVSCGTLDAPTESIIPFAIWLDNTFQLFRESAVGPPYPKAAMEEIERLERITLNAAHAVLPFSSHVAKSVVDFYGVPAERVHAIGCGSGPMEPFDGTKTFSEGHLLFVAKHLFSYKGGDLLLEAFPLIREARPQTKLVLIGNDEARKKAEGMDGVETYGYVDRDTLNRFFHGAAMLVQPMLGDPWGQVYLEAMKARAIVVSLNVAALPELTDNGRLGVLVDRPDPQQIAEAVLATYARPQAELDALTREAQDRTVRLHSWKAVGERVSNAVGLDKTGSVAAE